MNGIFDSEIHFVRVANFASEFDLLGTSIYAHLSALPGVFARQDLCSTSHTLQGIGRLYRNPRKMSGFANALVGKAFEYAVADLFNNFMEPYYSLICQGIESATSTFVSDKVTRVSIDMNRLSCVRVAKECSNAEALLAEFGRFRMLRDARRTLESAARVYPGLEDKVDVIFCERDADPAYRFAVLTSLKSNPKALAPSNASQDFQTYPIDLAITIETARRREVRFNSVLGVPVVHLPLNVDAGVYAWENASKIVKRALVEGEKNAFLKFFQSFFRPDTPERYWVEFLAKRLEIDLNFVAQEICEILHGTPAERIVTVPVLLGAERDIVLDLGFGVAA